MASTSILIIEDDPDILELVRFNLNREGFTVETATDGDTGFQMALKGRPALVLLDLMLPGLQGLEICRELRQRETTQAIPIIILSAKGEESDVVVGLSLGADDYLRKPFSIKELVVRVRAVLRRMKKAGRDPQGEIVTIGPLRIDEARHEAFFKGSPLELTPAEFRLLQSLAAAPGRVFSREQLLDQITKGRSVIIDRNVDVHIRSIRKKLGKAAHVIGTVRGVGYKLAFESE